MITISGVKLSRRQVMIATTQKFSGISVYKSAKSKHQLFAIANYLTVSQDPIFMSYDRVGLFVMKLSQSFISHPNQLTKELIRDSYRYPRL